MAEHTLLSRSVVAERCGISVRTLERWAELGIGPRPIRLGPRLIRYRDAEVEAWLNGAAEGEVPA
ncbi:helix-turn-helix transcriptional regulator [Nonomuraea candida]|uniref:helix-turn-helix transcriptional regulator n=1 Tax=Nonomuraea candida TaxID=359159 RepID=UPI0005BDF520|nr:helix-turn-helix domain-containing protein [Nonomuraea candida]